LGHDISHAYKTKNLSIHQTQAANDLALYEIVHSPIITLAYDAIILCDLNENILALNTSAEQLYGWQEHEIKGRNIHRILHTSLVPEEDLLPTLTAEGNIWEGEIFQVRKDGQEVVTRCRRTWLNDKQGKSKWLLFVAQDISNQRQLEQTIHQQHQQVKVAHDIGFYTWDQADDQTTLISPLISRLLQHPAGQSISYEEFIGHVHPEDREALRQAIDKAFQEYQDSIQEYRFIDAEQNVHWIWAHRHAVPSLEGFPTVLLGTLVDMTEHYNAEEQLRQANRRISSILESITNGLIYLDAHDNVVYINAQAAQLVQHEQKELIGFNFWEKIPNLTGTIIEEKIRFAQRTRQKLHFEIFYEPWQEWFGVDLSPSSDGILIIYNDITEYKQIEITQRANQAKFRQLFSANIIGMQINHISGTLVEANDTFLKMIGYTQDDIKNKKIHLRNITPPEYYAVSRRAVDEMYAHGVSKPYEKEYYTKDGKRVPVLILGALADRNAETVTTLVVDMTLQKQIEHQQETFMSIVGHELRTPLTAINGSLQLAQRRMQRYLDAHAEAIPEVNDLITKQLRLIDQSLRQARVQNRLINDMLDISRLAIDKLELSLHPSNLIEIVQETVNDLRYTESNERIKLQLPEQATIDVLADDDRIGQVISNYITNALKYSNPAEPILVNMELQANEVRVWVHDHGPGLSPEAQQHIWDRYYRANKQKNSNGQNTPKGAVNLGLGLHICQVLIERHHGQVGVESVEGKGSSFWFSLPLHKPKQ
jgi:PAS domain S-box